MIENTSLILTTGATTFAAIAAWCSYKISKNSLDFQKNYAKNQNVIHELNRIIYNAETLQILIPKPLEISDEEFESIEPLFLKLKLNKSSILLLVFLTTNLVKFLLIQKNSKPLLIYIC